ncbi:MAG: ribulose-phosphate 3-epimerase [Ignavibacteriales bacterium]
MKLIAPSILSADFANLAQQIRYVEIGGADWLHCDIMDGHFVPNLTFGPIVVKAARSASKLPLDVHLMVENPDAYLEQFASSGAGILTVHLESVIHLNRTIQQIKQLGVKAGVAINPSTPVALLKDIAEYVDMVLIMSVNPGFGGQEFLPSSLRKIRETVRLKEESGANFLIQADGGIGTDNIREIADAGCDVFVIGSSIFKNENISAATAELKNIANTTFV